MKRWWQMGLLVGSLAVMLGGCGQAEPQSVAAPAASPLELPGTKPSAEPPLVVGVVNYPLAFFVEQLAGISAQLVYPVDAGIDPAVWQPETDDLAEYQRADLILVQGAGFAQWKDRYSLPLNAVRNTTAEFSERYITDRDRIVHSHGPEGEHSHDRLVPYTWLDLSLAAAQAQVVAREILSLRSALTTQVTAVLDGLQTRLGELDAQMMAATAALSDKQVIYARPVFQYFARRYQLPGETLDWPADQLPGQAQWHEFEHATADASGTIMIWDEQPTPETTAALNERGVHVVVFRLLDRQPDSGDFLSVMEQNLEALRRLTELPQSES